jgi:biotin transporter BioY
VIYAFGLPWMAWLFAAEKGMAWVLQWGMTNFLLGDALKLALAALVLPARLEDGRPRARLIRTRDPCGEARPPAAPRVFRG